ncbi:MAG: hypothetical protein RLZ12_588 [Bacillota bacterium]|jgi:ABC-type phosphate transport system auxiliary subunit
MIKESSSTILKKRKVQLHTEIDRELLSLYRAMQNKCERSIKTSKDKLKLLHREMDIMGMF